MLKSTSKPGLPALDRGLALLDHLIRSGGGPLRFGELREALPGVQDSTLTRILKALEGYGYLERDANTGYRITQQVRAWGPYLSAARPTLADTAQRVLDQLTQEAHESACITLLGEDRINALCSRSVEGGIRILGTGQLLHFEPDHAGALAILEQLPSAERQRHLDGPHCTFGEGDNFETSLSAARGPGNVLIDTSRSRPGVCRMAIAYRHGEQLGSVFFCLTQEACESKRGQLTRLLESARDHLGR
ncbi:MAG: helix-turn-helix domain-containing protein [Puniceicoccales bacterium]